MVPHSPMPSGATSVQRPILSASVLVPLALFTSVVAVYGGVDFDVVMGDDLWNTLAFENGSFASSIRQALLEPIAEKWRPIFGLAWLTAQTCLGRDLHAWLQLNLVLHSLNATLLALAASRASGSAWVGFVCGWLLAVSRFAAYQVLQMTGLLEGLGLFFFLLCALLVVDAVVLRDGWRLLGALVCAGLAAHTHERYLALAPALLALVTFLPVERGPRLRLLLAAVLAPPVFNLGFKHFVLDTAILVGTGGTHLSLDMSRIGGFFLDSFLNCLGWNRGPSYLSGLSLAEAGSRGVAVGLASTAAIAVVFIATFGRRRRPLARGRALLAVASSGALAFGGLLMVASITARVEYRWLVAPACTLALMLAAATGASRLERWPRALAWTALLVAGGFEHLTYRRFVDNLFFMHGLRSARSAEVEIVDPYRAARRPSLLVLVTDDPETVCTWYFANGAFFAQAWGEPTHQLVCAPTSAPTPDAGLVFRSRPDGTWQDVTPQSVRLDSFAAPPAVGN